MAPFTLVLHKPDTPAAQAALARQVAVLHAQAVARQIQTLHCPPAQKQALLSSVIDAVKREPPECGASE